MPEPLAIQPPRVRRGGLASVSEDLDSQMPVEDWRTGVQYTSQCDATGFIWGCSSSDRDSGNEVKPLTALGDEYDFYPAIVGARTQCTVQGRNTVIGDRVRTVAEMALTRVRYEQLGLILAYGDVGRDDVGGNPIRNPSVVYSGQVPAGFDNASPSGLKGTIQGLLDATCSCWDRQLVFHIPRPYLPHLLDAHLVEWDEAAGLYRMGDYIVSFDCYPNIGPDLDYDGINGVGAGQNEPNPDGSEVWIWATSLPLIGLDSSMVQSTISNPRLNLYDVVAEQGAILLVDPCCIYAAKAAVSG